MLILTFGSISEMRVLHIAQLEMPFFWYSLMSFSNLYKAMLFLAFWKVWGMERKVGCVRDCWNYWGNWFISWYWLLFEFINYHKLLYCSI